MDIFLIECIFIKDGYIRTQKKVFEDVPPAEFMHLAFAHILPGESYRRQLRSLFLCFCDVFRALINSLVC